MGSQSRDRTDEKLRYAGIHLDELRAYERATSNDRWENAHQESALFHLAGAVETLLHEINGGYSLGLALTGVNWRSVGASLTRSNQTSPAFDHLMGLRADTTSWLTLLFEWRNHGAHRRRIGKRVNLSTWRTVDNEFTDPRSGQLQAVYPVLGCLEVLERLGTDVRALIDECRRLDARL